MTPKIGRTLLRCMAAILALALAIGIVGCTGQPSVEETQTNDAAASVTAGQSQTVSHTIEKGSDSVPSASDPAGTDTSAADSEEEPDMTSDTDREEDSDTPSDMDRDETEEPASSEEDTSGDDASHSHAYTSEITKAATCTSAGTRTYTCSVCKDSYTESIAKTDHTYVSEVTKEPECEKTGVKTFTCTACGNSYTETIAAKEHDWDESGTCTRCGAIRDTAAEEIYQILISFKSKYPEGMSWTNENRSYISYTICPEYSWYEGFGCVAFAFELSDAAFGDLPRTEHYDISKIRVGDILRINNDSHSVIVLEVHSDGVVIAEGNYDRSVHWGRFLSTAELQKNLTFIWTRYPDA